MTVQPPILLLGPHWADVKATHPCCHPRTAPSQGGLVGGEYHCRHSSCDTQGPPSGSQGISTCLPLPTVQSLPNNTCSAGHVVFVSWTMSRKEETKQSSLW
jgi:hypothetical protein